MLRELDHELLEFRKSEFRPKSISIFEGEACYVTLLGKRLHLEVRDCIAHPSHQLPQAQTVLVAVVTRSGVLNGAWLDSPLIKRVEGRGRDLVQQCFFRQYEKTQQTIDQKGRVISAAVLGHDLQRPAHETFRKLRLIFHGGSYSAERQRSDMEVDGATRA